MSSINENKNWSEYVQGKFAPLPSPRSVVESYMMTVDLKKVMELLEQIDGQARLGQFMVELRRIVMKNCDVSAKETIAVSTDSIDLLYPSDKGTSAVTNAIAMQKELLKSSKIPDGCCISIVFGEIVLTGKETSGPTAMLSWSLAASGMKGSILLNAAANEHLSGETMSTKLHRFIPREFTIPKMIYEVVWGKQAFGIREIYMRQNNAT